MSFKILVFFSRHGRQLCALGVNCLFLINHNETSPSRLIVLDRVYFESYGDFLPQSISLMKFFLRCYSHNRREEEERDPSFYYPTFILWWCGHLRDQEKMQNLILSWERDLLRALRSRDLKSGPTAQRRLFKKCCVQSEDDDRGGLNILSNVRMKCVGSK